MTQDEAEPGIVRVGPFQEVSRGARVDGGSGSWSYFGITAHAISIEVR